MRIRILSDRAVISDNVPLIIDSRGYGEITVDTPDDKTYVFGFTGKAATEKVTVKDGKVKIPECFFGEQTLQTVVYRGDNDGIITLPCAPLKLYRLDNSDMFSIYVESAVGAKDVRDVAAEAIIECGKTTSAVRDMSELLTQLMTDLEKTQEELLQTKAELSAFKKLYDENVEKTNDIIRRVEVIEAEYDVLVK